MLRTLAAPPAVAERVATALVESNLVGHDSHGVGMVPRYIQTAQKGLLKTGHELTTVMDAGALLTIDGGMQLGQVIGHDATACCACSASAGE